MWILTGNPTCWSHVQRAVCFFQEKALSKGFNAQTGEYVDLIEAEFELSSGQIITTFPAGKYTLNGGEK